MEGSDGEDGRLGEPRYGIPKPWWQNECQTSSSNTSRSLRRVLLLLIIAGLIIVMATAR